MCIHLKISNEKAQTYLLYGEYDNQLSSKLMTQEEITSGIQMRCDASPVPADDGVVNRAASEQISAATKLYCYHGKTLYTTNGIYDY